VGVSVRTVSRWERGAVEPDPELKKRLLRLKNIVERRLRIDHDPERVLHWLTSPLLIRCPPVELLASKRIEQILSLD
jgi:transcriptional regulator with XRE-family HTH domain